MDLLNSLKSVSDNFESDQQKEFAKQVQKQEDEYNKQYLDIIENLEQRLFEKANQGKRKLYVGSFMDLSRDFNYYFNSLVKNKTTKCYESLIRLDIEAEVIPNIAGNLKKVYEYLKEKGLNPELEYTTDYSKEGFAIVVKW